MSGGMFALLGEALAGWLIADVASGVGHWWEDRVGRCDMPVIGRFVVRPNRVHHADPLAFTRAPLLRRNLPLWVFVAFVSLAWLAITGPSVVWAFATLGGLVVNEAHRCAHLPASSPRWIRGLQDMGLLQSGPHHAGHHREPRDRRYCILTNLLNPVLDALHVWDGLELALAALGLEPNRGTA